MSARPLVERVLEATPRAEGRAPKTPTLALVGLGLGLAGAGLALVAGLPGAGLVALYVSTVLVIGLAVFGVVLSAIFEMTGAKWGRAYRRLAEGSVVLMPLGLSALLVLVLGSGGSLPFVAFPPHEGGKALWLARPFWSARVLLSLLAAYAVALAFLHHSLRRDFCLREVRERFRGRIASLVSRGITVENALAEAARSSARMALLAPVVAIVFGVVFSFLGFDLIMALEPDWFSTLFGAWYFGGHLFAGLAILALASLALRRPLGLGAFLTQKRQRDLATLLFAFTLLNVDFFWSQYLTIWYGNLPEETGYLIRRAVDERSPYTALSWPALAAFFFIPFALLIFRRIRSDGVLLAGVAIVVVLGLFLARFLEIAPPLLHLDPRAGSTALALPLASALLVLLGFAGAGWWLYRLFLDAVPIMPVGDPVFVREFEVGEGEGKVHG